MFESKITIGAAAAALLVLLTCSALAQEAPDALYQKFHEAARTANVSAMSKLATSQRAKEIAASSMLELKLLAETFPATYKITAKQVSADGNRMQFRATGMHSILGSKPELMHGIVDLVRIKGEWKVDKVGWAQDEWPAEKLR